MLANNVPAWFEIPTTDIQRAQRFYEQILGVKMTQEETPSGPIAFFPFEAPLSTGALVKMNGYQPHPEGTVIYLNLTQDLDIAFNRVEKAGGKQLVGKTELPDNMGYWAQIQDTEGNRVGLYSQQ